MAGDRVTTEVDFHSVITRLIKPGEYLLDVGCRGWAFSEQMRLRGLKVIGVDPGPDITRLRDKFHFIHAAIGVEGGPSEVELMHWSTGEGDYVRRPEEIIPAHVTVMRAPTITLQAIMAQFNVQKFNFIKLDCEGAEYALLEQWPGPIADQISVEYHDFSGMNPDHLHQEQVYHRIHAHLGQWYDVVQHERTVKSWMPDQPPNPWDSLYVLKGL